MKSVSGKKFCKILEKAGWELFRIKGSHHIYKKESVRKSISVPVHGNQDLKIGMLKDFMKTAELNEEDLE
ncbi:MAG: type II toxin-antitoxin system HicA family toxin [Candidatus Caenarcaniphilales bacterium]|nr:type II toxin-antitoxin system HicA family toxin [Candidatus Caenarcaniphilales bacterium]